MESSAAAGAKRAKAAQMVCRALTSAARNAALESLAKALEAREKDILAANEEDLKGADGLSAALRDRLSLTSARIKEMAAGVRAIARQPEVIGKLEAETRRSDGLIIQKERIPLGVIAMIFESRPNVVIDCAALAIKSGNAMLLKGGKEAKASNHILGQIVQEAIAPHLAKDLIQVFDSEDRSLVGDLIRLKGLVDLAIPRGGEGLINYVYDHAKVPVIAHFKGLCHAYVDQSADLIKAAAIVMNAKVSRPGVCNAIETLLLHRGLPKAFCQKLFQDLKAAGVELRLDQDLGREFPGYSPASAKDWDEEYLDLILAVKRVDDVTGAIQHISHHGSLHTETVIAEDEGVISAFRTSVDCSCIAINASSRFNDGGQLGLGAELGISTTKLHAYGPMGAAEMTTLRYVVIGAGHVRA